MMDASHKPLHKHITIFREIMEMALGCGGLVEGKLGYVPAVEGEDADHHTGEVAYTNPEQGDACAE